MPCDEFDVEPLQTETQQLRQQLQAKETAIRTLHDERDRLREEKGRKEKEVKDKDAQIKDLNLWDGTLREACDADYEDVVKKGTELNELRTENWELRKRYVLKWD
ncbi:hypothetical protein HK097_010548 [Rhizophlyctis rosea]|uniref:Uncharacterized protein n=1 Tax=Rhizophlyctis rosea TaxID=64517 RepID=A0AAD5S9R8_9FUNG|nr:hypothetical protein HK097_010548 [Rhizophlyctis rosea]